MITFLTEILELTNFGHMATSAIYFELRHKTLLVTPWTETMTSKNLFKHTFILKKPKVPILLTSKFQPCLLPKSLKAQTKLKGLEIMF